MLWFVRARLELRLYLDLGLIFELGLGSVTQLLSLNVKYPCRMASAE